MIEDEKACIICKNNVLRIEKPSINESYNVDCPKCGKYLISIQVLNQSDIKKRENWRALLSHWTRIHQTEDILKLNSTILKNITDSFNLPSIDEQFNNLLLWIGSQAKQPSYAVDGNLSNTVAIIGCIDHHDVKYFLEHLKQDKLIIMENPSTSDDLLDKDFKLFSLRLTIKGWNRYYELQHTNKNSKLAFMAMKFKNVTLTTIFNNVIKKAVSETGFEIRKLDEEHRAGSIDDKLRVEIRRSRFLISDLTDDNNGAYWEAGFAEGLGIPVIYICEESKFNDKEKTTHFDTNHHLTLTWNEDDESLNKFAEKLKVTIRETLSGEAVMGDE